MRNYYTLLLDTTSADEEILRMFFLHPLSRDEKKMFSPEEQLKAVDRLFAILKSTSTEQILDVIEKYKNEIQEITTGSLPQFSELEDADRVPDIVLSNPNCKYKLIGYFFNKDAADYSNQKYGENHYKLAAQIGLCEYADKTDPEGITAVTYLGIVYKDLPKSERDILRPKLCLQVPFIQHILVEARYKEVNAMGELQSLLTPSTSVRRRSSIQQMMHAIEATLTKEKQIVGNIKWGYKNR